jgi:uncharacterized protein YjbJ (UPF0337 family)
MTTMAQTPEQVASKLKQSNNKVQQQAGRTKDHELLNIQAKRAILMGKLQKRYGQRPKSTPSTE